ncbi:MAG TPA: MFS transporter, partial [Trebonia sp.]|nr:MFS transporter [Trebonia sp.]
MPTPRLQGRLVVIVCCSAIFMTTLDGTILNVALPELQGDLHASGPALQWMVDGYVLVRASSLFICGALGDHFGRRRIFRLGVLLFTLGSLTCSLAGNSGQLILFRAIQGAGSALMTPSSLAILTGTLTDKAQRARAIGTWSGTTGVSMAAGPVLGGLLVVALGWRSVFWVNVPIGVACLIASYFIGESRAAEPRPLDLAGQVMIAGAIGTLTYSLIAGPDVGWGAASIIVLLAVSALCWGGFGTVERRIRHPFLPPRYFRAPALSGAVVIACVAFLAMGAFLFFNTLYLQEIRGLSPALAGLLTAPATTMSVVFSPWAARRIGATGPRLPATLACALVAAGMAALAVEAAMSVPVLLLIPGYLLLGAGYGMVNPPATNSAVSALPADQAGVAAAITSTARQVGTNLGVALVGAIVFSSGVHLAGGSAVSPHAAALFESGLRNGYAVTAVLSVAATAVA